MIEYWRLFVLEQPWPLAVLLVVFAAIAWLVIVRHRLSRGWRLLPPGLVGGAMVAVLLGAWVQTHSEAALQETRSLVAATAPLDAAQVEQALAEDVRLLGPAGGVWLEGPALRRRLVSLAESRALDQRVVSVEVLRREGQPDVERTVLLELRTRDEALGAPLRSTWVLTWQLDAERWRLLDVKWVSFNGQSPGRSLVP